MITALFISLGCFGIVCAFTAWTICAVAGRYDDDTYGAMERNFPADRFEGE
jgi:hypothetical protein